MVTMGILIRIEWKRMLADYPTMNEGTRPTNSRPRRFRVGEGGERGRGFGNLREVAPVRQPLNLWPRDSMTQCHCHCVGSGNRQLGAKCHDLTLSGRYSTLISHLLLRASRCRVGQPAGAA